MYVPRHERIEASPPISYGEGRISTPEAFISAEGAQHLVAMVMEGRIDPPTGQLLPLKEERTLMNGPGYMMKPLPSRLRYDMVLPEPPKIRRYGDGGDLEIRQSYSVSGALYGGLTDERQISLGPTDIEHLRYERAKLEQTLARRFDLKWLLNREQAQDAYHIAQKNKPASNSDGRLISPVRVYVPGGTRGVQIFNRVMESGVDFASAKVWVPQAVHGQQDFRQDTPIFTANTASQLRSVVNALCPVAAQGFLRNRAESPVGIPIEGVPGAFVAQAAKHQSFNGEMADFWSEPIRIACNSLPLRAGQIVTFEWVNEAARRATVIAQQSARDAGINPACHALLPGQDMRAIMSALRG